MSITRDELEKVDGIRCEISKLEVMISSFESPYVKTMVGLVDVNQSCLSSTAKSQHSDFFHNSYKDFRNEITKMAADYLRHRIKELNLELSKYIS